MYRSIHFRAVDHSQKALVAALYEPHKCASCSHRFGQVQGQDSYEEAEDAPSVIQSVQSRFLTRLERKRAPISAGA